MRNYRRWQLLAGLVLLVLSVFLASGGAKAQGDPAPAGPAGSAPAQSPGTRETVFSLTMKGGWLMVPIGLCSLVALTVALERAVSLRKHRVGTRALLGEIFAILPPRSSATREALEAAGKVCKSSRTILSRVLALGVERIHRDEAHAQACLEEVAAKETHLLKRKLRPFAVVASLAPLLGLLGTIFGMITCFENAVATDTASRAQTLANGIYLALVTTAAGLTVAIPTMAVGYYFQGRVDRIADLLEEVTTEFLDHYYGVPPSSSRPPHAPKALVTTGAAPTRSGAGT